ncbi:MAG: DUF2341 domain-containing protein [Methanosarcinales archaeon]|nr:DUF2341 domain-containing protein [Methanosarcinales archaeon]
MANYYVSQGGSRILNATRVDQSGADNTNVIDWVKTNNFIIAININSNGKDTEAAQYKLRWRNKTDSGTFADVGAATEINYNATTDLVNGNPIAIGGRKCDSQGGDTWAAGEEVEGTSLSDSIDLADEYETEIHFALDCSGATDEKEYEFELYDSTLGVTRGTCGATITMEAGAVEGWLTGWSHRKEITITGQSGAGTNFQVDLDIGDSAGGDFHLEGNCTNFPQDIQVTDNDGTTLLDYWIEDITADPLKMWVEVADDLGTNQTIYVYYGKSGATTDSDGTATFLSHFDGDSTGWTEVDPNTHISFTNNRLEWSGLDRDEDAYVYQANANVDGNIVIEHTIYFTAISAWGYGITGIVGDIVDDAANIDNSITMSTWYYTGIARTQKRISDAVTDSSSVAFSTTTQYWVRTKIDRSGNATLQVFSDAFRTTQVGTDQTLDVSDVSATLDNVFIINTWNTAEGGRTTSGWLDNFFIRKYLATEPAFSSAGSEETPGATEVYLTLSQNLNVIDSGQAAAQGPVTLSNTLTALDGSAANALGPVVLSDILSTDNLGQADIQALITLNEIQSIANTGIVSIEALLTLDDILNNVISSQANTQAPLTLSNSQSITNPSQANTQAPVTLNDILTIANSGQAGIQGSTTLSTSLQISVGAEAISDSTITIAEVLSTFQAATVVGAGLIDSPNKRRSVMGIPAVPNNQIYGRDKQQIAGLYRGPFEYVPGILSIQEILTTSDVGQVAANSSMSLSKVLAILQNHIVATECSVSLAEILEVSDIGQVAANAFTTFAKNFILHQASISTASGSLTLNEVLTILQSAVLLFEVDFSLAEILSVLQGRSIIRETDLLISETLTESYTGNAEITGSVSLNDILTILQSTISLYNKNLSLSQTLNLLQSGLATSDSGINIVTILDMILAGVATTEAATTFINNFSVAQTAEEITQTYLTLAYNLAIQSQGTSTAAATLSIAVNAGISATVTIDLTEALSLSQSLDISLQGRADSESGLSLNNIFSVSVLAEALASAGISLNMVKSIITNGTLVSITVTTPEGRTVVIGVEIRTDTIPNEVRTVEIPVEDRTAIIR